MKSLKVDFKEVYRFLKIDLNIILVIQTFKVLYFLFIWYLYLPIMHIFCKKALGLYLALFCVFPPQKT